MVAASPRRWTLIFCLAVALESTTFAANPKPIPTKADISYGPLYPHQA
jgi:hypothetical protein